jgi:hypothetical protein
VLFSWRADPFHLAQQVFQKSLPRGSHNRLIAQAATQFARKGGKARAKKLTAQQLKESASKAAQARWAMVRKKKAGD